MEAIRRIILKEFPEIKAKHHLPIVAKVVAISPGEKSGVIKNKEPKGLDIVPLNENYQEIDLILRNVPFALGFGAGAGGLFCYPKVGTLVEFCFLFGRVDKPYIREILPFGAICPLQNENEIVLAKDEETYQKMSNEGNHERFAKKDIVDHAGGIRQASAKIRQVLSAPKTHIGSESENALTLIADALDACAETFDILANHGHPAIGAPPNEKALINLSNQKITQKTNKLKDISS